MSEMCATPLYLVIVITQAKVYSRALATLLLSGTVAHISVVKCD